MSAARNMFAIVVVNEILLLYYIVYKNTVETVFNKRNFGVSDQTYNRVRRNGWGWVGRGTLITFIAFHTRRKKY